MRDPGSFDCDNCHYDKRCDYEYEWPGSKGPQNYEFLEIDGFNPPIASRVCFLPMVTNESRELVNEYTHYKNKILPYPGGSLNQPNGYVKAMAVIDNYVNKKNNNGDSNS